MCPVRARNGAWNRFFASAAALPLREWRSSILGRFKGSIFWPCCPHIPPTPRAPAAAPSLACGTRYAPTQKTQKIPRWDRDPPFFRFFRRFAAAWRVRRAAWCAWLPHIRPHVCRIFCADCTAPQYPGSPSHVVCCAFHLSAHREALGPIFAFWVVSTPGGATPTWGFPGVLRTPDRRPIPRCGRLRARFIAGRLQGEWP